MPRTFLPILILSLVACSIEVDISVPGFPDMARYFNVDDGTIQMTIAYNFLGFCIGAVLYGPLSDAYGRRPMMVWGNTILAAGAIGCVIAPSIPLLLWARFIQGIGASASAVVVFAMIADAYPNKDKAASLIGMMNAVLTILMAIAPIAGGFINEAIGWRGNYGIVALICWLSLTALALFLPETKTTFETFQVRNIRKDYTQLLKNFSFISASMAPSLLYGAYLAFIAQAPFLYTETFRLSLIAYVLHQATIVLVFAVVSLLSGKIIQRLGSHSCVVVGSFLCGISSLFLVVTSLLAPNSPYLMTFFMSILSTGNAICYPIIFTVSLEIFPKIKGTASSAIMSMRSFVCFAFIGATGYFYNGHPFRVSLIILTSIILALAFMGKLLLLKQFTSLSSLSVS